MDIMYILRLRDYACMKLYEYLEKNEITIYEYVKLCLLISQMINHGQIQLKADVDLLIEKMMQAMRGNYSDRG